MTHPGDTSRETSRDTSRERYSYVFDGNAQVLDQILLTPTIPIADYDVVHINAEFNDQASDHDPRSPGSCRCSAFRCHPGGSGRQPSELGATSRPAAGHR
jgi:hypothetical protein